MSIRGKTFWMCLIATTAIATACSFLAAPFPNELLLQHVPTVLGLITLSVAVVWFRPAPLTIGCCLTFLWLHLIGARWIYSFVPYDLWWERITGDTLSNAFGWKRNQYDRMVHFASGVLGVPIFSDFLQSVLRVRPGPAAFLSIAMVLAVGAIYEIIEWQIAMTLSPGMAESYNGQQGDVWDPQKDLALAWIGATIICPLVFRWIPSSVSDKLNDAQ